MKKTLSIHLGRQLFTIEEDAYQRLTEYLKRLEQSLSPEEGIREILEDIEMRCAEILQLKLTENKLIVVTLTEVEDVIASLGEPEMISEESSSFQSSAASSSSKEEDVKRRLFRDMDNASLGGVCSGLAAYLNIDPVIIRILFAISLFMGFGFPLYIILWIVIPNAKTPSDRLQLRGKPVTVDSIKDEISRTAKTKKSEFMQSTEKLRNNTHISERARYLVGIFAKIIGVGFIVFSCIWLIGFTLTVSGVLQVFPVTGDQNYASFHEYLRLVCPENNGSVNLMWWSILLTGFTAPLIGLILGIRIFLNKKSKFFTISLIGLPVIFVCGVILIIISSIHTIRDYEAYADIENQHITLNSDELIIKELPLIVNNRKVVNNGGFSFFTIQNGRLTDHGVHIKYKETTDSVFHIYQLLSAHGIDRTAALKRSMHIKHELKLDGNKLLIDPYYSYPLGDGLRDQEIEIIIEVPKGKKLFINGMETKIDGKEYGGVMYSDEPFQSYEYDVPELPGLPHSDY